MFAEGVGTGTVCVEKVGATTQSISVMVTGRKCVCVCVCGRMMGSVCGEVGHSLVASDHPL